MFNKTFEIIKELPFLPLGAKYELDVETGNVWRLSEDNKPFDYPLRNGLAGYLWLLCSETEYVKEIKL